MHSLHKCSEQLAVSQSLVPFLPGFEGPLPFELETGYIGVQESEFFYYFVKSEGNPKKDPLLVWFTGGPGCSSFSAFVFEIGPLHFRPVKYNGSLPTLVLNPYSWTKTASIIFIDWPVGTGFSYATTRGASQSNDWQQFHQAYMFLKKWLVGHPEFISNPFYVGGESYCGVTVPIVTQFILDGNEADDNDQPINLQGYIVGNPSTYPGQDNYLISFTHRMGIISEEFYHSLVWSCGGEYMNVDPNNVECVNNIIAWEEHIKGINCAHILEPACGSEILTSTTTRRDILEKQLHDDRSVHSTYCHRFSNEWPWMDSKFKVSFTDQDPSVSTDTQTSCRLGGHALANSWMDDKTVRDALHARDGSMINQWIICNRSLSYTRSIMDTREYYLNLSKKGCRSLVYSGDHDMIVTSISTEAWIKNLNYSIVDDWRSWNVDAQVAGYTRTYSNNMTFATLMGGGHTAPEYRPKECYAMFRRWLSGEPL